MMWTRRQSVIFMAVVVFVAIAGALALRFVVAQEVGPKSCVVKADCPADQYCIANRCNVPPPVWNGEGITGFAPQSASFSITGGGAFGGFNPDPQWRVTTPSIYIGGGAGQAGTTIKDGKITTDSDLTVKGLIATNSDVVVKGKIAALQDAIVLGRFLRSDQLTEDGSPDYYFKATPEITIGDQGQLGIGTIPASKISGLSSGGGGAATGPWLTAANDSIYYSAGNVGIGTNSPVGKLHVQGTSDTTLKVETTTTSPFNVSSLSLYHGAGNDWSIQNEGGVLKIVDVTTGDVPVVVQDENLSVNGDSKLSGDFYLVNGKAIRMDGVGTTQLNIGNWNHDGEGIDMNVLGNVNAFGNIDAVGGLCIKGVCKTNWDQVGGTTAGGGDECSVSIFKNASTVTSTGAGGGYTGVNAKCGAGQHVCTTDEIIKSLRCHVSVPISGSMWVIEGPPGYTAAANDCMGWESNFASHLGAYWDFGQGQGGVGWMTICSSELPFACCQ